MQGLAIFGLIIVTVVIYCVSTLLVAIIINAVDIECGNVERFIFYAWLAGCALFEMVVLLWATKPFPIYLK